MKALLVFSGRHGSTAQVVVVDGRRDLSLLNYGKRTMKPCVTAPKGDFRRGNLIRDWGRQVVHETWDGRPH